MRRARLGKLSTGTLSFSRNADLASPKRLRPARHTVAREPQQCPGRQPAWTQPELRVQLQAHRNTCTSTHGVRRHLPAAAWPRNVELARTRRCTRQRRSRAFHPGPSSSSSIPQPHPSPRANTLPGRGTPSATRKTRRASGENGTLQQQVPGPVQRHPGCVVLPTHEHERRPGQTEPKHSNGDWPSRQYSSHVHERTEIPVTCSWHPPRGRARLS